MRGALLALAGVLQVTLSLKLAAFNIRSFGESKISNATISSYIVQILSRYDIAVVQEVRDSHLKAVKKLLDKLNEKGPDTYQHVVSEPLGRSTYKERYLFVFRPDQVSVLDWYMYDDGCEPCGNDTFNREPAIIKFSSPYTGEYPWPRVTYCPGQRPPQLRDCPHRGDGVCHRAAARSPFGGGDRDRLTL